MIKNISDIHNGLHKPDGIVIFNVRMFISYIPNVHIMVLITVKLTTTLTVKVTVTVTEAIAIIFSMKDMFCHRVLIMILSL